MGFVIDRIFVGQMMLEVIEVLSGIEEMLKNLEECDEIPDDD